MPLYTLRCPECGEHKETLCKASERTEQQEPCPACGAVMVYDSSPELVQSRDFGKGAYRFQTIDSKGQRRRTTSNRGDM